MDCKGSEKYYRSVFEQSPEGIFIADADGHFLLVNPRFCDMLGYSKEELLQMGISDIYNESGMDLKVQLNEKKVIRLEHFMKRKHGTSFYAQLNLKLLDDGCMQGIAHEIKMRTELMLQLHENQQRFQQLTSHIRDVFFLIDLSTAKFLYISPSYEEIWQQSIDDLMKDPTAWMASIHPDDQEQVKQLYIQHLHTGKLEANYRIVRSDSTTRWIHARTFPIYDEHQLLCRSAGVAEDITEHMQMMQERLEYAEYMERSLHDTIVAISRAGEYRDAYTAGHQSNVAYLSGAIAHELKLSKNTIEGLKVAAQIHDLGKIGIPIGLLMKPVKLSSIEFELIKTHVQIGYDIIKDIHFPWPVAETVLQHHERINGSGYPRGLKGDSINIEARVLAVADTIDAMSSHRPYRAALGLTAARSEIKKWRGILFDPAVVDACEKLFLEKKITLYS
ncbi:PAS domain S-box protein [Legionella maioricensis]|uniref:PAS domain S-box protein n=1 Tax=Legionella maioricensis TaxID=2896528 RepID=A0A9X2D0B1_9GAMM|nr:HD domain-containing phosphohydrolase [Legionella maioricensis]MCL9684002.1 PAS domain S-box protein [Legionella maioricensis]MCL9687953.1 PAS domain S-box protein [Legionella maioricensis]